MTEARDTAASLPNELRADCGPIWLVIYSLVGGGTERAALLLAAELGESGVRVDLITLTGAPYEDAYPVPERVVRKSVCPESFRTGPLATLRRHIAVIRELRALGRREQPAAVLAFGSPAGAMSLVALSGAGIPIGVTERTDPRTMKPHWSWRALRALTYRRAAMLAIQTEGVRDVARKWISPDRIRVIENLACPEAFDHVWRPPSQPLITCMGRLVPEKGHDVLLRALPIIAGAVPEITLRIVGDGPCRNELVRLARSLGVDHRVTFTGFLEDPFETISESTVFALPSRTEGLPNALLEAMAVGVPCVAADCGPGVRTLITTESNGVLVPVNDPAALAQALIRMIVDATSSARFGIAARARASLNHPNVLHAEWSDALASLVSLSTTRSCDWMSSGWGFTR